MHCLRRSLFNASVVQRCAVQTSPANVPFQPVQILARLFSSTLHMRDSSDTPKTKLSNEFYRVRDEGYRKPFLKHKYKKKYFDGGFLPRPDDETPVTLKPRRVDSGFLRPKRILFGENDYIDILGDEDIHPKQLINGPDWLVGFRGNEYQRTLRRLKFHGQKLKEFYPVKYEMLQKRMRFLYKKHNHGRRRGFGTGRK